MKRDLYACSGRFATIRSPRGEIGEGMLVQEEQNLYPMRQMWSEETHRLRLSSAPESIRCQSVTVARYSRSLFVSGNLPLVECMYINIFASENVLR